MQFQMPPGQSWFGQLRGIRNGFIAGLIVGMLIGWFFHELVGFVLALGVALLLLIPLAIVIWYFFFRSRGETRRQSGGRQGGMRVYTWGSGRGGERFTIDPRQQQGRPASGTESPDNSRSEEEIIDLEFEELKRRADNEERRS